MFTFQSLRHRQITSEFPTVPSLHLLPHNQVQFAIATATITIAAPNSLSTTVLPSNTYQSRKPCQTSKSNDPFQGLSTINKILQNRSSNIAKKLSMVQGGRSIHPRSIDAAAATTTNVTATAEHTESGPASIDVLKFSASTGEVVGPPKKTSCCKVMWHFTADFADSCDYPKWLFHSVYCMNGTSCLHKNNLECMLLQSHVFFLCRLIDQVGSFY